MVDKNKYPPLLMEACLQNPNHENQQQQNNKNYQLGKGEKQKSHLQIL